MNRPMMSRLARGLLMLISSDPSNSSCSCRARKSRTEDERVRANRTYALALPEIILRKRISILEKNGYGRGFCRAEHTIFRLNQQSRSMKYSARAAGDQSIDSHFRAPSVSSSPAARRSRSLAEGKERWQLFSLRTFDAFFKLGLAHQSQRCLMRGATSPR